MILPKPISAPSVDISAQQEEVQEELNWQISGISAARKQPGRLSRRLPMSAASAVERQAIPGYPDTAGGERQRRALRLRNAVPGGPQ